MSITLFDYLTASGRYLDREKKASKEIINNANNLLNKVNSFLTEIGIAEVIISSGYRPIEVNASIPNAAKASLHCQGRAIDISDPDGSLDKLVAKYPDLMRKYGLFQEHPDSTKGWCHLDCGVRSDRPSRQFKP
jgi:uncharacterized protein YcbK (DUF882 family)